MNSCGINSFLGFLEPAITEHPVAGVLFESFYCYYSKYLAFLTFVANVW